MCFSKLIHGIFNTLQLSYLTNKYYITRRCSGHLSSPDIFWAPSTHAPSQVHPDFISKRLSFSSVCMIRRQVQGLALHLRICGALILSRDQEDTFS